SRPELRSVQAPQRKGTSWNQLSSHSPGAGRTFRTISLGAEALIGGEFSAKVTVSKRISFTLASKSSSPTRAKYDFPAGALMMTTFIDGSRDVTTPAIVASAIKIPFKPGGLTTGITGVAESGFGTGLTKGSRRPRAS